MPFFQHDGLKLHYEDAGTGRPVLLLHGLGSSTRDWEMNEPALRERHRVLSLDFRGHGRSDKPREGYGMDVFAGEAVVLLDHLGVEAAHVVGISMGGMVALQMALDAPSRVRSLVVCNAIPTLIIRDWRVRVLLWQRMLLGRLATMRQIGKFLSKRLFPKPEQGELRAFFIERWAANDKKAYVAAARSLLGWSVRVRLGEITCPTLVLAGDRDFFPLALKQRMAEALPNGRLQVIEDSGHATPVDQAEAFNAAVLSFFEEVD